MTASMWAWQHLDKGVAELREVPVPIPGAGEVLVKIAGAGVCHSDLHLLHGRAHAGPTTLGHEVSGHVSAAGTGVSGLPAGTPVVGYLCWGCGRCRTCAAGFENYCEAYGRGITPGPGLGHAGAMAEYIVMPERFVVPLGEGLDPVDAAPLTDAALTPWHAVNLVRDRLTSSATAVVIGVGGLGHMAVQVLAATTGSRIIAVDQDQGRLAHADALGASEMLISGRDTAAELLELTHGRGADVVLDFVGVQPTLDMATASIAPLGHVVVVGLGGGTLGFRAAGAPVGLPWGAGVIKPYGGTRAELHDVLDAARRGDLTVRVERHPLHDVATVFDRLEAGQVDGRAVLVPPD